MRCWPQERRCGRVSATCGGACNREDERTGTLCAPRQEWQHPTGGGQLGRARPSDAWGVGGRLRVHVRGDGGRCHPFPRFAAARAAARHVSRASDNMPIRSSGVSKEGREGSASGTEGSVSNRGQLGVSRRRTISREGMADASTQGDAIDDLSEAVRTISVQDGPQDELATAGEAGEGALLLRALARAGAPKSDSYRGQCHPNFTMY